MTRPERRGDWQTYRRLLGYVRPYWPLFILAIAGYAIGGAAEAWFVRMFGDLVDGWQNNTSELARSIPLLIVAAALAYAKSSVPLVVRIPPVSVVAAPNSNPPEVRLMVVAAV